MWKHIWAPHSSDLECQAEKFVIQPGSLPIVLGGGTEVVGLLSFSV